MGKIPASRQAGVESLFESCVIREQQVVFKCSLFRDFSEGQEISENIAASRWAGIMNDKRIWNILKVKQFF
jgi:hypothetical protein